MDVGGAVVGVFPGGLMSRQYDVLLTSSPGNLIAAGGCVKLAFYDFASATGDGRVIDQNNSIAGFVPLQPFNCLVYLRHRH